MFEKQYATGTKRQLQRKVDANRNLNVSIHDSQSLPYRSIHIDIRKIKTVAPIRGNVFHYCSFFTFTRGYIFWSGILFITSLPRCLDFIGHIALRTADNLLLFGVRSRKHLLLTATFSTPCTTLNWISLHQHSISLLYPRFLCTCAKRFDWYFSNTTTIVTSATSACFRTTLLWRTWVANQFLYGILLLGIFFECPPLKLLNIHWCMVFDSLLKILICWNF